MMSSSPQQTTGATGSVGPVVLVLQSDADSREMYAEYFSHLHWRAVPLTSGREVLAAAPGATAIVTDICIGGDLDAFTLIRELKHDEHTKDIPVVVVTAWTWKDDRDRAAQAGCDAFLAKPCLPEDLVETVVQLLASKSQSPQDSEKRPESTAWL